jgi:hypothetical protein
MTLRVIQQGRNRRASRWDKITTSTDKQKPTAEWCDTPDSEYGTDQE